MRAGNPQNGLSRREFLKTGGAGLAGLAALGAYGCGGSGGGGDEIVFSWIEDSTGTLPTLIEQFNQQNRDNFQVKFRTMSQESDQHFDQLRTEFQAASAEIDVVGGDVIWPAQFASQGWLLDLTDRFTDRDEFLPGPMQAMTYEGKVYGVPWYTDSGLLYYRKDLLEKSGFSGPPRTWEELKQQALRVKEDSGTQAGFVFQGSEYEGGVCNACEYIWTHGGDVLDPEDPSKVVIGSPESVAGFAAARSMIEDGVARQAVLQYIEDDSDGAFIRGDAVFERCWPYVYALVGDPKMSSIKPEQVGVAQLPVGEEGQQSYSALGGWNFFINATSEKQDQAWEFIRWMTAPEQLRTNALKGSRLPTRRSLYEDREILENVPVARLAKDAIIQNTRPRPVSPVYSDMSLEIAEKFNAALGGEMSPEAAVEALQKELSTIAEQGQSVT